jgi:hypothetical protein
MLLADASPKHDMRTNMAISYKTLYEEEKRERERLAAEVDRLSHLVAAGPDESLRELERTRKVVDLAGIAAHMRVERFTPQQWRQRGLLPPVDFPEIKEPLWYASTIIEQFIIPTRRVWYDTPGEELSPAA